MRGLTPRQIDNLFKNKERDLLGIPQGQGGPPLRVPVLWRQDKPQDVPVQAPAPRVHAEWNGKEWAKHKEAFEAIADKGYLTKSRVAN